MTTPFRAEKVVNALLTVVTVFMMVVLCAVTLLQIIFRYVLNAPLSWTEELVRYLLVWTTFIGFGLVAYKRSEMSVAFFTLLLPAKLQKIIELAMLVLILAFLCFFVVEGFVFAFESSSIMSIALPISYTWINICAPIGGVFLLVLYSLRFVRALAELRAPESVPTPNSCPPDEEVRR